VRVETFFGRLVVVVVEVAGLTFGAIGFKLFARAVSDCLDVLGIA
jgi:hypothetical protein